MKELAAHCRVSRVLLRIDTKFALTRRGCWKALISYGQALLGSNDRRVVVFSAHVRAYVISLELGLTYRVACACLPACDEVELECVSQMFKFIYDWTELP